jgi:hypothetical protein
MLRICFVTCMLLTGCGASEGYDPLVFCTEVGDGAYSPRFALKDGALAVVPPNPMAGMLHEDFIPCGECVRRNLPRIEHQCEEVAKRGRKCAMTPIEFIDLQVEEICGPRRVFE